MENVPASVDNTLGLIDSTLYLVENTLGLVDNTLGLKGNILVLADKGTFAFHQACGPPGALRTRITLEPINGAEPLFPEMAAIFRS